MQGSAAKATPASIYFEKVRVRLRRLLFPEAAVIKVIEPNPAPILTRPLAHL